MPHENSSIKHLLIVLDFWFSSVVGLCIMGAGPPRDFEDSSRIFSQGFSTLPLDILNILDGLLDVTSEMNGC